MNPPYCLVTGANGFLGARLVRKLVERGERVKAFVRPGADLSELRDLPEEQVKIAQGDARIQDRVYAALSGCDRLYHVAGSFSLDERGRSDIFDNCVTATDATLLAAERRGLKKIVCTSSVASLGSSPEPTLLDESGEFELTDPNAYAAAKYEAEQVALGRAEQGLPVVVVCPSFLVGPGDHKPTPAGRFVTTYLGHSPSFRVPIPPGGFSYVDVDDAAEGHILAMEKGTVGERYVLGGENLTNREVVQLLSDVTGLAEPGEDVSRGKAHFAANVAAFLSLWSGEAPLINHRLIENYFDSYVFVSSEKAKRELGYVTRPARAAFARSCRWFLDHGYVPARAARRARLELAEV